MHKIPFSKVQCISCVLLGREMIKKPDHKVTRDEPRMTGECILATSRPRGEKGKRLKPGAPVLGEALSAIDGSSLGRLERYFAILTAV